MIKTLRFFTVHYISSSTFLIHALATFRQLQENHTYHAYAWLKLFNFTKAYNKNMTADDLKLMASSVVLSTLSIAPYDRDQHQVLSGLPPCTVRVTARLIRLCTVPIYQ